MKRSLTAITFCVLMLGSCATTNEPERQPLTLEQLVTLAKEGKDAQSIIQEIQQSRTLFDITASQYAKLSRDGVPDAVLDFMQNGQMRLVTRQARREALDDAWFFGRGYWGYGAGVWAPRPYYVWVNGRAYKRSY